MNRSVIARAVSIVGHSVVLNSPRCSCGRHVAADIVAGLLLDAAAGVGFQYSAM